MAAFHHGAVKLRSDRHRDDAPSAPRFTRTSVAFGYVTLLAG